MISSRRWFAAVRRGMAAGYELAEAVAAKDDRLVAARQSSPGDHAKSGCTTRCPRSKTATDLGGYIMGQNPSRAANRSACTIPCDQRVPTLSLSDGRRDESLAPIRVRNRPKSSLLASSRVTTKPELYRASLASRADRGRNAALASAIATRDFSITRRHPEEAVRDAVVTLEHGRDTFLAQARRIGLALIAQRIELRSDHQCRRQSRERLRLRRAGIGIGRIGIAREVMIPRTIPCRRATECSIRRSRIAYAKEYPVRAASPDKPATGRRFSACRDRAPSSATAAARFAPALVPQPLFATDRS